MVKKYNVAIVGATGAVGQEMLKMLEKRHFPVEKIFPFASFRSKGRQVFFNNEKYDVIELTKENVEKYASQIQLAMFSAGASIAKEYAPIFAEKGIYVVDNSSAFRMEEEVPLVVPEVNDYVLTKDKKIIANPNCSTIQMVVVLNPIHKFSRIKRILVSTYQSVSGAGGKAMIELQKETQMVLNQIQKLNNLITDDNKDYVIPMYDGKVFPRQIAFNLIPQIDVFLDNLYTKEEMKMVNETRKIMNDKEIKISAQCVRTPVFRAHSETVWIETEKKVTVQQAKEILSKAENVKIVDEPKSDDAKLRYPTPIDASNQQVTYVGRIREDLSCENGLVMWIVSDNLLKGAALNAVQILESMIKKKII
jgi:aspartate-semialdehyde dehydrogenase